MDDALVSRLRELTKADPSLGYRGLHAKLKEEPEFKEVGLKKVQTALQQLRDLTAAENVPMKPVVAKASEGENIWTAASDGDIQRVEELMSIEGFTPTSPDENGYTPVHAAASWCHLELLEKLLQRDGSAANVRDSDGDTPLHHVAENGDLEAEDLEKVVDMLLAHGANPELKNNEGKNPLECCGAPEEVAGEVDFSNVNVPFLQLMAAKGFKHLMNEDAMES
eukprot:gnl/MRDRNA2_/MRDRNA2_90293_c0_seq1.p1 gnl/MRDRNA2_/MRDRNA2_90293_c0~~gnl/MRDRNA2_/MRDRNA2_90293_c0_seq1.p1  ORF type:complete len:223 (-),score=63.41 gnl/MRDRNA2_/MRDRNA2_90293_c0_seq1:111-779(-)